MLWRIADAVTDDVEDGEAGSLATGSQQHIHILAPGRRFCCRNLGKSWAQELNSMDLCVSVKVF